MDAHAIARRVWGANRVDLEPLGGGITNHNFKVTVDGHCYVLRVSGADTELLGINRVVECAAARAAAELGIAPEVVAFVEPEGYLVTRFVDGAPAGVSAMRDVQPLGWVATSLRAFHGGPPLAARFDSFRIVEQYAATAEQRGAAVPAAYGEAKPIADEIERRLGPRRACPCHNDLLNANFIDDGRRLWLVDWEYAGNGDPFFDLANFSVNHDLDADGEALLLRRYLDDVSERDVAVLRAMKFMSDFREAMWGVVQSAVSTLEFDFSGYAAEHFGRLGRTAADPSFREALGAL